MMCPKLASVSSTSCSSGIAQDAEVGPTYYRKRTSELASVVITDAPRLFTDDPTAGVEFNAQKPSLVKTRAELTRHLGVSRSRIMQVMTMPTSPPLWRKAKVCTIRTDSTGQFLLLAEYPL